MPNAKKDYSSEFSKLSFEERAKKTLKMWAEIENESDPYENYVAHPLLNKDHSIHIANMSRTLMFTTDVPISEFGRSFDLYVNINNYQELQLRYTDLHLSSRYNDHDSIVDNKAEIIRLKLGFCIQFNIIDKDEKNITLLEYSLASDHPIDTSKSLEFTMKYIPNEITKNLMARHLILKVNEWLSKAKFPIDVRREEVNRFESI